MYRASDCQSGYLAWTGATVLTGADLQVSRNATILIKDGKIVLAGTTITLPAGTPTIDLAGHTILPGLIHCTRWARWPRSGRRPTHPS
jgi:imidazolonepropionase-like amidohydrolase